MNENGYYMYFVQIMQLNSSNSIKTIHTRHIRATSVMDVQRIVYADCQYLDIVGDITLRFQRVLFGKSYGPVYTGRLCIINNK